MYCLMSALSTKAKSIFSVTLDVVRMTTFECLKYNPQCQHNILLYKSDKNSFETKGCFAL